MPTGSILRPREQSNDSSHPFSQKGLIRTSLSYICFCHVKNLMTSIAANLNGGKIHYFGAKLYQPVLVTIWIARCKNTMYVSESEVKTSNYIFRSVFQSSVKTHMRIRTDHNSLCSFASQ